jgi:hypothetical protein
MRVPIIVVLFLLVYLPTSFAQSAAGSQSSLSQADEQKLRESEESLLKAENENNKDLLASLLASDFQTLTPDGRTFDRAQVLDESNQRATMHFPYRVEHSDLHMFRFGNTAVIAYTKGFIGTEGGVAGKVRKQGFVDVFTKDASGWKLHFTKAEAGIAAPQQ